MSRSSIAHRGVVFAAAVAGIALVSGAAGAATLETRFGPGDIRLTTGAYYAPCHRAHARHRGIGCRRHTVYYAPLPPPHHRYRPRRHRSHVGLGGYLRLFVNPYGYGVANPHGVR